jgi:TatD DNase family protein
MVAAHLRQAMDANVGILVQGGYSPSEGEMQIRLLESLGTDTLPKLIPCWGLHPWLVQTLKPAQLQEEQKRLALIPSRALIGELGLDFSKGSDEACRALQVDVFVDQLRLAKRLQRPLVLHVVRAHGRALDILRREGGQWFGWVHGFSGSVEVAQEYRKMGLFISVGPRIFSSKSTQLRRAVARLGLEDLVIESDWPHRWGEAVIRGDLVVRVGAALAHQKGVDFVKVQRQTAQNVLSVLARSGQN